MDAAVSALNEALDLLDDPDRKETIVFIDTVALALCPDVERYGSLLDPGPYTAVIPATVLNELEKHLRLGKKNESFLERVERAVRRVKGWRNQGSLIEGITVHGTVRVRVLPKEPDFKGISSFLDPRVSDDRIVARALEVQRENPAATVIVATKDMNLQTKAELAGLGWVEVPDPPPADADAPPGTKKTRGAVRRYLAEAVAFADALYSSLPEKAEWISSAQEGAKRITVDHPRPRLPQVRWFREGGVIDASLLNTEELVRSLNGPERSAVLRQMGGDSGVLRWVKERGDLVRRNCQEAMMKYRLAGATPSLPAESS